MSDEKFRVKNFFGQFILLLSFSEFRQTFLGPLETSLRNGCQKCLVGSQRKVLEKNRTFGKTNFWKKTPDIEWKTFGRFKNCFLRFHRKILRKNCSPQNFIRNIPILDSAQKILGRFSNLYSSCTEQHFEQSIVFWKKHFFIISCELEWKKSAGSSNLLVFCRGEQLEVKHVFGTENNFPCLFLLCTKDFRQNWEPHSSCQGELFEVICNFGRFRNI